MSKNATPIPGDQLVRHSAGQIDIQQFRKAIGPIWVNAAGEVMASGPAQQLQWKPYTASNMLEAMTARQEFHEAKERQLFEKYAADFPYQVVSVYGQNNAQ